MTAAKHTPGPWGVMPTSSRGVVVQRRDEGGFIVYGKSPESEAADAHLIAAAPDLLEALKPFAAFACSPAGECSCPNCKARDALVKARCEA